MINIRSKNEFYTELCDSQQTTIIHTGPKGVPEITSWDMEAALRDMKNWTATGNDHINIEKLKAEEDSTSKTSCKLNAYQKDEYPQRGRTLRL